MPLLLGAKNNADCPRAELLNVRSRDLFPILGKGIYIVFEDVLFDDNHLYNPDEPIMEGSDDEFLLAESLRRSEIAQQ